ncbi:hypothetical protein [Desulfomonile tiedjei]|uniref:hypothetical protein n=1 Tax=Desulfomonile tiedjei TaxID=2358 RepID=UPI00059CB307|nr:hypothetical protein [Desulfomonile tiedjei]
MCYFEDAPALIRSEIAWLRYRFIFIDFTAGTMKKVSIEAIEQCYLLFKGQLWPGVTGFARNAAAFRTILAHFAVPTPVLSDFPLSVPVRLHRIPLSW